MTTRSRQHRKENFTAREDMKKFLILTLTPNSDGDLPIELAACVVVFFLCMAALMHMPG